MAEKEQTKKKYSYIKKPFSKNGWYSFFLGLIALLLTIITLLLTLQQQGQAELICAALGVTGLLASAMGLWFTALSFREQGRNAVLARIGGILSGILLLLWLLIAAIGVRL